MVSFLAFFARRSVFFIAVLLLTPYLASAQVTAGRIRHFDDLIWKQPYYRGPLKIGWSLGRTWYQGDLTDGLRGSRGRNSIGAALSTTVWPNLEVALEGQYIRLAAEDQVAGRGYRFATRLAEVAVLGRYYIERYHFDPALDAREQAKRSRYRPFVVAGVGEMLWWAATTGGPVVLGDSTLNKPEQTYPAYATVIPVGAGVALRFSPLLWISPELTYRFALTDNLDDVGARRGNAGRNDGYWQLALRFQYAPPRSHGKHLH